MQLTIGASSKRVKHLICYQLEEFLNEGRKTEQARKRNHVSSPFTRSKQPKVVELMQTRQGPHRTNDERYVYLSRTIVYSTIRVNEPLNLTRSLPEQRRGRETRLTEATTGKRLRTVSVEVCSYSLVAVASLGSISNVSRLA